jgi:3-oxoacyl-[acyl-carrier-protein] synthase II
MTSLISTQPISKQSLLVNLKILILKTFMDRKLARKMDRFAQYGIVSSEEAIKDSRLIEDNVDKDRIGVIWGAGIGGLETFQNEVLGFASGNGTPRFNPFMIPKMIPDIAPGIISIRNGFRGPNFATVSCMCFIRKRFDRWFKLHTSWSC